MITIGQLAGYAGVTVRAVRHYHKRGLLEEPERDASGYRRYTAHHAIELIKIKTLTDAGVPLARIKELRDAGPAEFARAVEEIDGELEKRIADLTRTRERIRGLAGGDRLFVPDEIADYLDHLRAIGLSDRYVRIERDLWILTWTVQPKEAVSQIADRLDALDDPRIQRLFLDVDRAFAMEPDDPALDDIARRMVDITIGRYDPEDITAWAEPSGFQELIQTGQVGVSPGWDEMYRLALEHYYRALRRPER